MQEHQLISTREMKGGETVLKLRTGGSHKALVSPNSNLGIAGSILFALMGVTSTLLSFSNAFAASLPSEFPSPNLQLQCAVLPIGSNGGKVTSYEQVPDTIRAQLNKRFELSDNIDGFFGPVMASRDDKWQGSVEKSTNSALPQRRFIDGGHYMNRWFIWYERSEHNGHTFHLAIADVAPPGTPARLIYHIVEIGLFDLCDTTMLFMANPNSPSALDDSSFW